MFEGNMLYSKPQVVTLVFLASLLAAPLIYTLDKLVMMQESVWVFVAGIITLPLFGLLCTIFVQDHHGRKEPLYYVWCIFSFTAVVDLFIALELDGYVKGFMEFYLREGEPYLRSSYGTMINWWDGTGHFSMYLGMIYLFTNGKDYRTLGLYWVGSITNSMIVFMPGNVIVWCIFSFTAVVDLFIALELDGYVKGFMEFYLREGEPYLRSSYGTMINWWDGTGHFSMYLGMIYLFTNGKDYRTLGLYWVGSITNSMIVFMPGNVIVWCIFSFTAVVDLFIALELDGYVKGFMEFYLREGEPYLRSSYGTMINWWDGTGHFSMYLGMIYLFTNGKDYRTLGLYWVGSITNSMIVFMPGNVIVWCIFSFTAVVDLFIALELDGYVKGFMEFYLREGEPYLRSSYGTMINWWDGTGHFSMYLGMIYLFTNGKDYRTLGLYWVGSITNSMIVFMPGNVIASLLAAPLIYTLDKLVMMQESVWVFVAGIITLPLFGLLCTIFVQDHHGRKEPLYYVWCIFSFTAVVDLFIALELDGYVKGFMEFYLREGEPYLRSSYGTMINWWDGTGHFSMYLGMIYLFTNGKDYRTLGLYWVGSITNSMIVFMPGNVIGNKGLKWSYFLNVPYVFYPIYAGVRFLRDGMKIKHKQTNGKKKAHEKVIETMFAIWFILAIVVAMFRYISCMGCKEKITQYYLTKIEPYLDDPIQYGRTQALCYFYYFIPFYVAALCALIYPGQFWIKDWSLIHAGASIQAQLVYVCSSLHWRTEVSHQVPDTAEARAIFWLVNLSLVIVPHLFALYCHRDEVRDFFSRKVSPALKSIKGEVNMSTEKVSVRRNGPVTRQQKKLM